MVLGSEVRGDLENNRITGRVFEGNSKAAKGGMSRGGLKGTLRRLNRQKIWGMNADPGRRVTGTMGEGV